MLIIRKPLITLYALQIAICISSRIGKQLKA